MMICFDLEINGEKICRAGVGDFGVLNTSLTWARHIKRSSTETDRSRRVKLVVGGMTNTGNNIDDIVYWVNSELGVNDEITIKVIESGEADEPIERTPEESEPYCPFCRKKESEVSKLIYAPPNHYICNECIEVCNRMIDGSETVSFGNNVDESVG